ncbi:MAG: periplasmic-type flagellar collar protein FlbB [Brevinema sp.]
MSAWIKVFLLLLLNILIAGLSLYTLNYMHIIDYRIIFQNDMLSMKVAPRVEDPLLLEREELSKKWELLDLRNVQLSNAEAILQLSNTLLLQDKDALIQDREAFQNQLALVAAETEASNSYDVRITEVASQISGMPPLNAAEILNLQEDLQVVEIFKKMNEISEASGQASTVPYLLTLLNRAKAARVQALMLESGTP